MNLFGDLKRVSTGSSMPFKSNDLCLFIRLDKFFFFNI